MADNVDLTSPAGSAACDEVSDGTLGTVKVQYVKIMDGTLDGTTKAAVGAGGLKVDLGADNDVTLATLPDTSGGDLATISGDTTSLDTKLGEVSGTPTANTILGRLKDIDDQVTANAIAAGTVASRSTDILSVMPAEVHTKAAISAASSGDNTLLAAQGAGNSICVTSLFLVAASAVTVRFESGAGGTALTGVMSLAANSGFVLPYNPDGWFETGDNALLNLELGGAVQVSGAFSYVVR